MAGTTLLTAFHRHRDSPFADGYDIDAEAEALRHLIDAAELDPNDPLYARFVLFEERSQVLRQWQAEHALRQRANREVSVVEASRMEEIGRLEEDGEDEMVIHTHDAMRLFLGRDADPATTERGMAGGKRVAAALRQLWHWTAQDNPYVDWALVQTVERVEAVRQQLAQEAAGIVAAMEGLKQRGLSYSIVRSAAPVRARLGFRSPYGYGIAALMVDFDYCVRCLKSAQRRDLLSSAECHKRLFTLKHHIRSIFEQVLYLQKNLGQEDLRGLCRADFSPAADVHGMQRAQRAGTLFQACPSDVFNGDRKPRHSLRRIPSGTSEYQSVDVAAGGESEPANDLI